jgi:hypothetical protein
MHAKIAGLAAAVAAAVAAGTVAVAVAPAGAAVSYYYFGSAGGSSVKAVNSTVTSALSAESSVLGRTAGQSDKNSLASVHAQGVLSLGGVATTAAIKAVPGGQQVVVTSRVTGVNVLNGLITASAITTTTTTSRVNGVSSSTSYSDFAGLKIVGVNLPVTIQQNFGVRIPGVASIVLNGGFTATQGTTSVGIGAGLGVTLLQSAGSAGSGAEVYVAQTYTIVAGDSSEDTGHGTIGNAYATAIHAAAGKAIDIRSDPTSPTTVFSQGTGGETLTNSLAGVNLAPVGTVGAVKTTGTATNTRTVADLTTTAQVAGLNLLNGLVQADAVTVTAHASLVGGPTASTKLVGLVVAGRRIAVNVKPNTVINLGIGKLTINQQLKSGNSITVCALDLVLGKPAAGLPVGAEIQLALASAAVK